MPKLFQRKYRTSSFRLKHYDYTWPGAYFVTICTQERKNYFGKIENGKMRLNKLGQIAEKCWRAIPQHFPFVILDYFCVMPNHVHGIIIIDDCDDGRDDAPRDDDIHGDATNNGAINNDAIRRGAINRASTDEPTLTNKLSPTNKPVGGITGKHNPMNKKSLGRVVRWLKGRSTFEIRKFHSDFAWQALFHDRIIRTEQEFHDIQQYIFDNPCNWGRDRNNF